MSGGKGEAVSRLNDAVAYAFANNYWEPRLELVEALAGLPRSASNAVGVDAVRVERVAEWLRKNSEKLAAAFRVVEDAGEPPTPWDFLADLLEGQEDNDAADSG